MTTNANTNNVPFMNRHFATVHSEIVATKVLNEYDDLVTGVMEGLDKVSSADAITACPMKKFEKMIFDDLFSLYEKYTKDEKAKLDKGEPLFILDGVPMHKGDTIYVNGGVIPLIISRFDTRNQVVLCKSDNDHPVVYHVYIYDIQFKENLSYVTDNHHITLHRGDNGEIYAETKPKETVTRTAGIDFDETIKWARLMKRAGLSNERIFDILKSSKESHAGTHTEAFVKLACLKECLDITEEDLDFIYTLARNIVTGTLIPENNVLCKTLDERQVFRKVFNVAVTEIQKSASIEPQLPLVYFTAISNKLKAKERREFIQSHLKEPGTHLSPSLKQELKEPIKIDVLETNRQTGRTTRMLNEVLAYADKHKKAEVIVVCHFGNVDGIREQLKAIAHIRRQNVSRIRVVSQLTFFKDHKEQDISRFLFLKDVVNRAENVFIDHDVIYSHFGHILKAFHKWDAPSQ